MAGNSSERLYSIAVQWAILSVTKSTNKTTNSVYLLNCYNNIIYQNNKTTNKQKPYLQATHSTIPFCSILKLVKKLKRNTFKIFADNILWACREQYWFGKVFPVWYFPAFYFMHANCPNGDWNQSSFGRFRYYYVNYRTFARR